MLNRTGNLEPGSESVAVGRGTLALSDIERWLMTWMVHVGTLSGTSCSSGHVTLLSCGSWGIRVWHKPQESGATGIPCEAVGSETKEMWQLKKKKKN